MDDRESSTWTGAQETRFHVRSYELDGFGHLNHAVYLNYFEQARFDALAAAGLSAEWLVQRGRAVHVVRIEVDYRKEARMGQDLLVLTRVAEVRNSSMTLEQRAVDPTRPATVFADGRVVVVWIGPNGRPAKIPAEARTALSPSPL